MTDTAYSKNPFRDLTLISALILFLELALIRWLPAHVVFLTFFTNTVLLASFIGMSIGCLLASRPQNHLPLTPLWLVGVLAAGLRVLMDQDALARVVQVGNQKSAEVVFFGTEYNTNAISQFKLPI